MRNAAKGDPSAQAKIEIVKQVAQGDSLDAPRAQTALENLERAEALEQGGFVHPLELPQDAIPWEYYQAYLPDAGEFGWYADGAQGSPLPVPEAWDWYGEDEYSLIGIDEGRKPPKVKPWPVRVLQFVFVDLWRKGAREPVPAPQVKA